MKLIDKSAVVAEIERKIHTEQGYSSGDAECGYRDCAREILSFLDTLEVKEVDLEKEVEKYLLTNAAFLIGGDSKLVVHHIAKHFFELGLSVNSPITASDRGIAEEIIFAQNALGEEKMIAKYLHEKKGYPIDLNGNLPSFDETMKDTEKYLKYKQDIVLTLKRKN